MTNERLADIQDALSSLKIPAWLLYSFRDTNPISTRLLGLAPEVHQSRRWALLIPARGEPRGIAHRIEPHIGKLMPGNVSHYSSHLEFVAALGDLVQGLDRVAMEYSPGNALPVVSRVDAGTVELVRSFGVEVVSSGTLIAMIEAKLTEIQIASAIQAGGAVRSVMMDTFRFLRERITDRLPVTEFDVQQFILHQFDLRELVTDHSPICGVGANSADPHYEPTSTRHLPINRDDFVLIDLWGRHAEPGTIFGDITWVGYMGQTVPDRFNNVFDIVRNARDASLRMVQSSFEQRLQITGAQLDDAARNVISAAGYADRFVHRTGHSITSELHGAGANLDNFETNDDRPILSSTSFSIEPGIYLPGDFGVRSELDVVIDSKGTVIVPSEPLQHEIVAILE